MKSDERARLQIAQETARVLIEEGVDDYLTAKRKAARRLGLQWIGKLPGSSEVDEAIDQHQRLFRSATQGPHVRKLRKIALQAMLFLEQFAPTLVGNVVDGNAGEHSPVILYLVTPTSEEVVLKLLEANIPFMETAYGVADFMGHTKEFPAIQFQVDGTSVKLILFPSIRTSRETDRKNRLSRATIKAVRAFFD